MCDQDKISHYSINTILSRKVMRIKKTTSLRFIRLSNTKFSELTS